MNYMTNEYALKVTNDTTKTREEEEKGLRLGPTMQHLHWSYLTLLERSAALSPMWAFSSKWPAGCGACFPCR